MRRHGSVVARHVAHVRAVCTVRYWSANHEHASRRRMRRPANRISRAADCQTALTRFLAGPPPAPYRAARHRSLVALTAQFIPLHTWCRFSLRLYIVHCARACVRACALSCLHARNLSARVISELSMGPFCLTQSNPTHQLTDPTRPNPLQVEKFGPNPTQYN